MLTVSFIVSNNLKNFLHVSVLKKNVDLIRLCMPYRFKMSLSFWLPLEVIENIKLPIKTAVSFVLNENFKIRSGRSLLLASGFHL